MPETEHKHPDTCFFCNSLLTERNRSDEHVFPRWLMKQARLWDKTMFILNGTTLPYRQCLIPCCKTCNNGPLSRLENEIAQAFDEGPEALRRVDQNRLLAWAAKFYVGTKLRLGSLSANRKDVNSGPLIPQHLMTVFSPLLKHMQNAIGGGASSAEFGATFVCQTHKLNDERDFDYLASTIIGKPNRPRFVPGFAIRHNGVGLVSIFGELGCRERLQLSCFQEIKDMPLHPVQFVEISAAAFYYNSLAIDRASGTTFFDSNDGKESHRPITLDRLEFFEWDRREFGINFFNHLHFRPYSTVRNLEDIFSEEGEVFSFLRSPDGSIRKATEEELKPA